MCDPIFVEIYEGLRHSIYQHCLEVQKIPNTLEGIERLKEIILDQLTCNNSIYDWDKAKITSEPITESDRRTRRAPLIHIEVPRKPHIEVTIKIDI